VSKVITPRTDETVLPLATVRLALRIDGTTDDTLLQIWRGAAFRKAEHYTGQSLGAQVRELALDEFPDGAIKLPYGPVNSITSITYIDAAGDAIVLASNQYTLDTYSNPGWLLPAVDVDWPDTLEVANAVKIRYSAGSNTLTEDATLALLMLIGHADAHRNAVAAGSFSEVPLGAMSYLDHIKDYS
jgi:uncharacterized phiE125 gp8 family phage protein